MKRRTRRKQSNSTGFNIGGGLGRMMGSPRTMKSNRFNFNNIMGKQSSSINYSNVKPTNFNKLFNLKDSDRDGVANVFDCQPYNKRYQDVRPNELMMERINKLPIFVTEGRVNYNSDSLPRKTYHISKAPKQSKRRVYSLIKKYPQVVGEVERKKPRAILFSTGSYNPQQEEYGWETESPHGQSMEGVEPGKGVAVVRAENIYKAKKKKFSRYDIRESASTAVHELEHVRQEQAWEGKPRLKARMKKGRYSQRPEENLARKAEDKLQRSRPEETMKTVEKTGYAKHNPKLYETLKEKYEKYKTKREARKEKAFRETFKDEDKNNEEEVKQNVNKENN